MLRDLPVEHNNLLRERREKSLLTPTTVGQACPGFGRLLRSDERVCLFEGCEAPSYAGCLGARLGQLLSRSCGVPDTRPTSPTSPLTSTTTVVRNLALVAPATSYDRRESRSHTEEFRCASLLKLVEDAEALAAQGKTSDAITKLRDFEVKVNQLEAAGRISAESAAQLREDAEATIGRLQSSST